MTFRETVMIFVDDVCWRRNLLTLQVNGANIESLLRSAEPIASGEKTWFVSFVAVRVKGHAPAVDVEMPDSA